MSTLKKSNLTKYTLDYNEKSEKWNLTNDKTDKIIESFETKEIATSRNTLRNAIGDEGGSVKIQNIKGKFQEERTYPKSKDPKTSKG